VRSRPWNRREGSAAQWTTAEQSGAVHPSAGTSIVPTTGSISARAGSVLFGGTDEAEDLVPGAREDGDRGADSAGRAGDEHPHARRISRGGPRPRVALHLELLHGGGDLLLQEVFIARPCDPDPAWPVAPDGEELIGPSGTP
jgi:hypothetical protein